MAPIKTRNPKKHRVCPSRQGRKIGPRRRPFIGEVINGHKVTGILPSNKRGAAKVEIDCGVCLIGIGTCLYTQLCHGVVKSCRCLRDLAYLTNQNAFAEALGRDKIEAIFTDVLSGMAKFDIAEKHGVPPERVAFVRRGEYRRLEAVPQLDGIYAVAQANFSAAMKLSRMTKAEVMAIGTIHKQRETSAAKIADDEAEAQEAKWSEARFEAQAAWNGLSPDEQVDAEEVVYNARWQMEAALQSANNTRRGRYRGELTPAEFSVSKRYSSFRWVYDAAVRLPGSVGDMLFEDRLLPRFTELVRRTLRRREERRLALLETLRNGYQPTRKVTEMPRRGVVWAPSQNTGQVVDMVIKYGQNEIAA
jgi:hypothetical protein